MNADIKVTFIIPKDCKDENECSEEMQLAFTTCLQHKGGGLEAKFMHETEVKQLEGLTKKDVFVLSHFEGNLYERLKATKCLLVGPRCLSCCLTEGTSIPSSLEPVYTIGMKGLVITASGLSVQKKENIKKKIHWMGGLYNKGLTDDTTHLVSDTVLSEKYILSVRKGIPVMSERWVEAVWESSLHLNINGSSSEFDGYRLAPFANLQVTASGLSKQDRLIIQNLINKNGGTYTGAFQSESIDVLVLNSNSIGSEKYKAALEYYKPCVLPSWVHDSAAKGVALPFSEYKVTGTSTSSPFADRRLPEMSLNFSRITNSKPTNNYIDESKSTDASTVSLKMGRSHESKRSSDSSFEREMHKVFDNLDMSKIKKAGPIFDGFCIWITGLDGVYRERATACVSRAGGVRYDHPHDRVTHVVSGSKAAALSSSRDLPNVPVLSVDWLVASVNAGRALDETEFLIDLRPGTPVKSKACKKPAESESPMSKRNLQLLRHGVLDLPPPTAEVGDPVQDEIVNHYLSQNMPPEPEKEAAGEVVNNITTLQERSDVTEDCSLVDEHTEQIEQIFTGMKIEIEGLDEEEICEIGAEVSSAGGVIVSAGAGGTHVVVPLELDKSKTMTSLAEPVTIMWIKDCIFQQELLPIQYYHRPVIVPQCGPELPPLHGVVLSLSTYTNIERSFLNDLAILLGAKTQYRFCRRNTATSLACTHLICPSPVGDKYVGAVKWGLPAVKSSWLMQCAAMWRRVSEEGHLVGDTKASQPPEPANLQPLPVQELKEQLENQNNKQTHIASEKANIMLPPAGSTAQRRGSSSGIEQTPKGKAECDDDCMSPASRYIAMARQGLLGGDTQNTPKRIQDLRDGDKHDVDAVRTPPLDDALSTPNLVGFSPTTKRRLQAVRRGEMPSGSIKTPKYPFENDPDTPDSTFGAALRPGIGRLSPDARKRLWTVVNDLPSKQSGTEKQYTPLSEIRNRFLAQFNSDAHTPPSQHTVEPRKLQLQDQFGTPPPKMAKLCKNQCADNTPTRDKSDANSSSGSSTLPAGVDAQLQRLSAALTGRMSSQRKRPRDSVTHVHESEAGPESQPNTVGWDDTTPGQQIKRFMLSSNVENGEEIVKMIEYLGGKVSEGQEMDPEATHLLCAGPGRSEKLMTSVAAGKWVLYPKYVNSSRAAGEFLPEEEYEWGNPLATCLPAIKQSEQMLAAAAHRWRVNRAANRPGPYAGMAALLHAPPARRRLLSKLIEAGDGRALDDESPYSNDDVTICFADIKRYPMSDRDAAWLISKRIPVCQPQLLSSYLTLDTPPNPEEHCLPGFKPRN